MSVRRLVAGAAAALLLVGALGGCGSEASDAAPTPKLPEPTSSTPPPSVTPEEESPEDFIRRWAQAEVDMENTGDTAEYRRLSRGCEACVSLANQVERFYADGGYVKWGGWEVVSIKPWGKAKDHYEVVTESEPTEYRESATGPVQRIEGGRSTLRLVLDRQDGWRLADKSKLPD